MAAASTLAIVSAVAGGVSAAGGIYSALNANKQAKKAEKQQDTATTQNADAAKKNLLMSQQATNQANARTPNQAAINSQTQASAMAGGGATNMLTGPQGIDPSALSLGKNTLLGT